MMEQEPHDSLTSSSEDHAMPLWEHLDELRRRMIRSLIAVGLALTVTYNVSDEIVNFLEQPLLKVLPEGQQKLYFTGLTDKFFVYLQVSVLSALVLVSPYLFFELWKFVSPGLKPKEKKFVFPFVLFATGTFLVGLAFGYYLVLPYGYQFLVEFGGDSHQAMITLQEYFSLTLKMLLGIGIIFELPVVLILLGKVGIVNATFLAHHRRYAFVGAAVVGAVITPSPDAFTMILVAVPLYLLYELSILGVRFTSPRQP